MARKRAKKKTWPPSREGESRRELLGTNYSSWPCPPLQPSRAADPLGRRNCLHLFALDGTCVLVALAFLGRCRSGRRASLKNASSLGRTSVLCRRLEHVYDVGAANEAYRRRSQVVESGEILQYESG